MRFADRINQLHLELGVQNQVFAAILGVSGSTTSVWKSRTDKEPDTLSVKHISKTLGYSVEWLLGDEQAEKWSPAIRAAQRKLRDWAAEYTDGKNERDRLVAAWEQFSRLLPDFPELSWAAHIHWVSVDQRVAKGKVIPSMSDWIACKQGLLMPGASQIAGASDITGIPESWFYTGDPEEIGVPNEEEVRKIWQLMKDYRLDTDDLVRLIKQSKSPR